jgi:hypothetical protein
LSGANINDGGVDLVKKRTVLNDITEKAGYCMLVDQTWLGRNDGGEEISGRDEFRKGSMR